MKGNTGGKIINHVDIKDIKVNGELVFKDLINGIDLLFGYIIIPNLWKYYLYNNWIYINHYKN